MGRITPSFRQLFLSEVEQLRKDFQGALLDKGNREAFDLLIRAWCSEDHAMGNSNVPCTLDIMNLMANVHNRKCVGQLRNEIKECDEKIREIERRMLELERLVEDHGQEN